MKDAEIYNFMIENKKHIGFGNYAINIQKSDKNSTTIATCEIDEIGQYISLTLFSDFFKMNDYYQQETLIHELVHSRQAVMRQRLRFREEEEEEKCVNDVARLCVNWGKKIDTTKRTIQKVC